jgi:hypothetical protein
MGVVVSCLIGAYCVFASCLALLCDATAWTVRGHIAAESAAQFFGVAGAAAFYVGARLAAAKLGRP